MKLSMGRGTFAVRLALAAAAVVACSSNAGVPPQKPNVAQKSASASYAFKVLASNGTTTRQINFSPKDAVGASGGADETGVVHTKSLKNLFADANSIHFEDFTTPTPGSGAVPILVTDGSSLVEAAAAECGMVGDNPMFGASSITIANDPVLQVDPFLQEIVQEEDNGQFTPTVAFVPAWTDPSDPAVPVYYTFNQGPAVCDRVLEYEETLVCMADKLAELADTVGPLTWHAERFTSLNPGLQPSSSASTQQPLAWTIPPPDEASKFIVRDMAINVLAHVAMMDEFPMQVPGTSTTATCAQLYSQYAAAPNSNVAKALFPFPFGSRGTAGLCMIDTDCDGGDVCCSNRCMFIGGGQTSAACDPTSILPMYPPLPGGVIEDTLVSSVVQERQNFEAGVLRGAGQLLHDLVRESVFSDLAGAAAAHGSPTCNPSGLVAAFDLKDETPYNSLGHIARTLLGRWEMDKPGSGFFGPITKGEPDPQCRGVAETELLSHLADPGLLARINDLGPQTSNEATADTLFERSGIVLESTQALNLGQLLTDRLVALDAGGDATTPAGQAITQLVGTLSASDLQHGANHNLGTFVMLTDVAVPNVEARGGSGLERLAVQAGLSVDLDKELGANGIAITGGLSRALVLTDPIARAGTMMIASQCPERDGLPGVQMDETATLAPPQLAPNIDLLPGQTPPIYDPGFYSVFSRQDVFAIGQTIRSRLVKLRQLADNSQQLAPASQAGATARAAAVSELGAWAGTGRMILSTDASSGIVALLPTATSVPTSSELVSGTLPSNVFLDFIDINPSDFGVQDMSGIAGRVSIVAGSAALAECAAALRTIGCDTATLQAAQWEPQAFAVGQASPLVAASGQTVQSQFGVASAQVRVTFQLSNAPTALSTTRGSDPVMLGLNVPLYVVLSQDPTKPPGIGEVLGALALPDTPNVTQSTDSSGNTIFDAQPTFGQAAFALSPMRRELLNDAFGLGKWVGARPPQVGDRPASGSPSFCVEGVPLDIFVPLQNDLTDSADSYENSWSHYLNLAQAAAANADAIGQEILQIGFQKTQSVENAAEQEITETGKPFNPDTASVGPDGQLDAGAANGAVAAILNQPTFDVVFLGDDPTPDLQLPNPNSSPPAIDPTKHATEIQALQTALSCDPNAPSSLCQKLTSSVQLIDVPVAAVGSLTAANTPNTFVYTAIGIIPKPQDNVDPTKPQCPPIVAGALQMKGLLSGNFNSSAFSTAVDVVNETDILGGMGQTTMIVNDPFLTFSGQAGTDGGVVSKQVPGHWSVNYAGAPVMDSDIPPSWPACLTDPKPITACNFSQALPTATSAPFPTLNDSLSDLFRWCPGSTDPVAARSMPLGQCEPNPDGSANPDAELNAIRWRVEAALWLAAAMSGDVPTGMFSAPMPATNFVTPLANPDSVSAPVNMFFGNGSFAPAPGPFLPVGGLSAQPDPGEDEALNPSGDVSTAPVALDPRSRYFQWGDNGSKQLPLWLLNVYSPARALARNEIVITNSQGGGGLGTATGLPFVTGDNPSSTGANGSLPPYVHVFGSNTDGPSDYTNLNGFLGKALNGLGGIKSQLTPALWAQVATLLDGQSCPAPVGDGNFGTGPTVASGTAPNLGPGWLQGLVAALKTQQSTTSDMRKPFYFGNGETWSMWSTLYGWNGSAFAESNPEGETSIPRCASATGTDLSCPNGSFWFDQTPARFHWYTKDFESICLCDDVTDFGDFLWSPDGHALGITQRNPSVITPDDRVRFALNSGAPNGNCDAAWQLTQAMALSCILGVDVPNNIPPLSVPPPKISSIADLAALTAWLKTQLKQSALALQKAFVTNVPAIVVASAKNVPGALSSSSGNVGKDLVQASNSLMNVWSDWRNVQSYGEAISLAIDGVRNAIDTAQTDANQTDLQLAIQKEGTLKNIADDVVAIATGAATIASGVLATIPLTNGGKANVSQGVGQSASGTASAATGALNLIYDQNTLGLIGQLTNDNAHLEQDHINDAINALNDKVNTAGTAMSNAYTSLNEDINNIQGGTAALTSDRSVVAYYAGKAAGADVWNCGSPAAASVECVSHVNTVLNRRYDGDLLRYQEALREAKAAAYLARLAIEQRIGVRLNDICQPIGTLAAPSSWADDVCHLTGVNYKTLQMAISPNSGTPDQVAFTNQTLAAEYADSFIGDYVQKLTDFVNFYNVAYPEQDGNDTVVLSLRETMLGGKSSCRQPSLNLIVDSSNLGALQDPSSGSTTGWMRDACSANDANCLQVKALGGLALPATPGGVTWLVDRKPPSAPPLPDGGATPLGDAGFANIGARSGGPDNVVIQQVTINAPGQYVLSWWDRAIDPATGQLPTAMTTPVPDYQVTVYNSAFLKVGGFSAAPNLSLDATSAGWSMRQKIPFQVAGPDIFYVAFAASANNAQPGSVAISDVQLEAAPTGLPSPYVDTDGSGQATTFQCALTPQDFQAAFQRNCDPDGTCHFDLKTPIMVNTQTMTSNGASLAGKLAVGNFNFRHIDVALNVVGTGVIDCSSTGSPDCFGSGFLQYSLSDNGSNAGVLGADGQYRAFDFGTATIDHAKAITAERYVTTPLGSTDQGLVSQFSAVQLRGRPLDGVYQLKIFDNPALHFDQIQDIQVILHYHFWSKVVTAQSSN